MFSGQMVISAIGENLKNKRAGGLGECKGFSVPQVPMMSMNIKAIKGDAEQAN